MRKKIVNFVLISILLFTSSAICYLLGYQKSASRTEDIVANEIVILERYSDVPNCDTILSRPNELNNQIEKDDILYWYYDKQKKVLKKLVITKKLEIAYDEVRPDCKNH